MILYVKNKIVSIGEGSYVKDEAGEVIFRVKGKICSLRHKKFIMDETGDVLYRVQNRVWHFLNHFKAGIYDAEKKLVAIVSSKAFSMGRFSIKSRDDSHLVLKGDVFGFNYQIYRDEELIGEVSRQITLIKDAFALKVINDEDAPFLVALVIAIDNLSDKQ